MSQRANNILSLGSFSGKLTGQSACKRREDFKVLANTHTANGHASIVEEDQNVAGVPELAPSFLTLEPCQGEESLSLAGVELKLARFVPHKTATTMSVLSVALSRSTSGEASSKASHGR